LIATNPIVSEPSMAAYGMTRQTTVLRCAMSPAAVRHIGIMSPAMTTAAMRPVASPVTTAAMRPVAAAVVAPVTTAAMVASAMAATMTSAMVASAMTATMTSAARESRRR
jgi:hypothetical protein